MVIKLSKVPYEDALNMTGWGRSNLQTLALCCGIISAMAFELYSVAYVVPSSACELGTTSIQQGLAAALPLVGVIVTSHLWGYLADTHGRRYMLVFSMAIGFVAGCLATLSPNWIVLCTLKFISSAAVSGASALAVALLGECTPGQQRSMFLLLTTTAFLTCNGIMAVLSIPVLPLTFSYYIPILDIHFNSWRLLNLIFSMPCSLAFVWALCSSESPKYLLSVGKDREAMMVLKHMFELNSGKSSELYRVESIILDEENLKGARTGLWASIVAQTVPMFKAPMLKRTLLLAMLFIMVFMCANSFVVWFPAIADAFMSSVETGATGLTICEMIRLSQNATEGAVNTTQECLMNQTAMTMVFCISVTLAVLNTITGFVIRYIGKRRLYIFIQILSGTAALSINASPAWILSAVLLLVLMMEVINFGFLSSFTVDLFPTYVKAKAVCLMLMLARASTILGINVLKQLIERNCEAAFYTFGVIAVCAGFLGLLLPPDKSCCVRDETDSDDSGGNKVREGQPSERE